MLARLSAALLGAVLFAGAAAAEDTTIKFTLGWKTQGSDAAFFYAKDNGFFKEEGLNVVIDQGEGSGATGTTFSLLTRSRMCCGSPQSV